MGLKIARVKVAKPNSILSFHRQIILINGEATHIMFDIFDMKLESNWNSYDFLHILLTGRFYFPNILY